MSDGNETASRVAELEARVAELEERLTERDRTVALLAAEADIDGVDATCPECRAGELRREAGITWARVICDECETVWRV